MQQAGGSPLSLLSRLRLPCGQGVAVSTYYNVVCSRCWFCTPDVLPAAFYDHHEELRSMAHVHTPSPPLPGFADIFERSPFAPFQVGGGRPYIPPISMKDWNTPGGYFTFRQPLFQKTESPVAGSSFNHVAGSPPSQNRGWEHADIPSGEASLPALQPAFRPVPQSKIPTGSALTMELLDRIEDEHEDLRDARDELLGSRVRLRTRRRELGAVHIKAVTQVGVGSDLLKRYLLAKNIQLPEDITRMLSEVDDLRDVLGKLAVEYEEAEEKYNLEEWRYTQKESKFVESLSTDNLQGSPPTDTLVNPTKTEHSSQSFLGPSDPKTTVAMSPQPIFIPHRPVAKNSNDSGMPEITEAARPLRPGAWDPTPLFRDVEHTLSLSKHNIERNLLSQRSGRSDIIRYINGWLWQTLETSSLEKKRLYRMLLMHDLSDDVILKLAEKYWFSDIPEGDVSLTGNATKSSECPSDTASVTKRLENFASEKPDVRTSSALQLLPQERVVDALEPVNFPQFIEPNDLLDLDSGHGSYMARCQSTLSASTQSTTMSHTSSGVGDSTSPIEEDDSLTSSEDLSTIRQEEFSDCGRSQSGRRGHNTAHEAGSVSSLSPKSQRGAEESVISVHQPPSESLDSPPNINLDHDQPIHEHDSVENYDADRGDQVQITASDFYNQTTKVSPVDHHHVSSSPPKTASSSMTTKHQSLVPFGTVIRIDSPDSSNVSPLRLTPISDMGSHKGAKHRSSTAFEPFIQIDSPQSWNLPLLRLTPSPPIPSSEDANHLHYLPFVSSEERMSPGLPGPDKFPSFFPDKIHR